jgi:lipopolysaccharide/colanic/teichoic acid biosynthesis glycosyltransferase
MNNITNSRKKVFKRSFILILIDFSIITLSFLFFAWIKPATIRIYLPNYAVPFLLFSLVWLLVSIIISKYDIYKAKKSKEAIIPVIIANLTILAVITTLIYSFGMFYYSRLIVFGTIILSTLFEIVLAYFYFSYLRPVTVPEFDETKITKPQFFPADKSFVIDEKEKTKYVETREQIKNIIINETGTNVYNFISRFLDVGNPHNLLVSTTTQFNIDKLPAETYNSITNLHRINDFRWINKFFEAVNHKLPFGGIYINSAETYQLRRKRILSKYPLVINYFYYFFDYLFTRVFPKLLITKRFYFYITLGRNRVISRAETLGRLYSCGFECLEEKFIEGNYYFVARKVKVPSFDGSPTYGPFVRLQRYGKNGKVIGVYKMRTMHAYSEYLQEYIYQKNQLQEGGKFKNDFRVTATGRFMRKFWLDELPMVFNILKGDMKLVGVRPLSRQYFNLYSEELKEKRVKIKPGLIPPFYADMPKTLEEIMESESKYIDAYLKSPFLTDFRYFFHCSWNIIFRRARSN